MHLLLTNLILTADQDSLDPTTTILLCNIHIYFQFIQLYTST